MFFRAFGLALALALGVPFAFGGGILGAAVATGAAEASKLKPGNKDGGYKLQYTEQRA